MAWFETEITVSSLLNVQTVSAGKLSMQIIPPLFFRQKSGLGYSTFDRKNIRLAPDQVDLKLLIS